MTWRGRSLRCEQQVQHAQSLQCKHPVSVVWLVVVWNLKTKTGRYGSLTRSLGLVERGCVRTQHDQYTPTTIYVSNSHVGIWASVAPDASRTLYRGRSGDTTAWTLTSGARVLPTEAQTKHRSHKKSGEARQVVEAWSPDRQWSRRQGLRGHVSRGSHPGRTTRTRLQNAARAEERRKSAKRTGMRKNKRLRCVYNLMTNMNGDREARIKPHKEGGRKHAGRRNSPQATENDTIFKNTAQTTDWAKGHPLCQKRYTNSLTSHLSRVAVRKLSMLCEKSTFQTLQKEPHEVRTFLLAAACRSLFGEKKDSSSDFCDASLPKSAILCPAFLTPIFLHTSSKLSCTSDHFPDRLVKRLAQHNPVFLHQQFLFLHGEEFGPLCIPCRISERLSPCSQEVCERDGSSSFVVACDMPQTIRAFLHMMLFVYALLASTSSNTSCQIPPIAFLVPAGISSFSISPPLHTFASPREKFR